MEMQKKLHEQLEVGGSAAPPFLAPPSLSERVCWGCGRRCASSRRGGGRCLVPPLLSLLGRASGSQRAARGGSAGLDRLDQGGSGWEDGRAGRDEQCWRRPPLLRGSHVGDLTPGWLAACPLTLLRRCHRPAVAASPAGPAPAAAAAGAARALHYQPAGEQRAEGCAQAAVLGPRQAEQQLAVAAAPRGGRAGRGLGRAAGWWGGGGGPRRPVRVLLALALSLLGSNSPHHTLAAAAPALCSTA